LESSLEEHYEILKTWNSKQWTELLSKYYDAPSRLVVRGRPSASLADRLKTEEKARIEEQVKRLRPEGLAELEKKLDAAKDEHEQPIPEEVLTSFPVPDVKSISWISVQSANNVPSPAVSRTLKSSSANSSELERHLQKDTTSLPMRVQFDHVVVCSHKVLILRNMPIL
jgi:Zn-dependent M16 (insulinase) family peptidase